MIETIAGARMVKEAGYINDSLGNENLRASARNYYIINFIPFNSSLIEKKEFKTKN